MLIDIIRGYSRKFFGVLVDPLFTVPSTQHALRKPGTGGLGHSEHTMGSRMANSSEN